MVPSNVALPKLTEASGARKVPYAGIHVTESNGADLAEVPQDFLRIDSDTVIVTLPMATSW